jgi:hypothetical protein
MRALKHVPVNEWPEADRAAFRAVYEPGDLFDGTAGPGAHLAAGTCQMTKFGYRRWLGFLKANYPDDLSMPPAERITLERVPAFIDHLSAQMGPSSVAVAADRLYAAARLIAPTADWAWLKSIKARLASRALSQDRFDRLVPPWQTLDSGIELMDTAHTLPIDGHNRGRPLGGDRLYGIVRARTISKFGKAMSLHDFRRAAATFLAMDAPEKIGLIPGVLQHVSPEVSEQHYNLARSMQAGQRFAAHARKRLRPLATLFGERDGSERRRERRSASARNHQKTGRRKDQPSDRIVD